jgi:ABC-type glucose/galactose transport system permease subunit
MDERTSRDDLVQQYLEDSIPKGRRAEIEHLAGEVAKGGSSRRDFLTRAASLGIGATAASTILTALVAGAPKATAATGNAETSKIADKYRNLTIGVPVYAFADENQITIANQMQAAAEQHPSPDYDQGRNEGLDVLLPSFTAAFIGAATFRFGEFNIFGTVVGVLVTQIAANGLILLGVPNYTTYVFQGMILLVALIFARVVALRQVT